MTVYINSVEQWDLFTTHVANVTTCTMLEYVDRSKPAEKFTRGREQRQVEGKIQDTTLHNRHREKEIRETEKNQKLKMLNMSPTLGIEAQILKAVHPVIMIW